MKSGHISLLFFMFILLAGCDILNNRTVLVIGDSISTGYEIAKPWPNRLAEILDIPINNNYSVNGVQSGYGLEIFEQALKTEKFNSVIIMLGTNDSIYGSSQNAIQNLQALVNLANDHSVQSFVVTLPAITNPNYMNEQLDVINRGIYQLADTTIIDLKTIVNDWSGLLADGIHPNDQGQALIATTIASTLESK